MKRHMAWFVAALPVLLMAYPAWAQMGSMMGGGMMGRGMMHGQAAGWLASLTAEQRQKIDAMHLQLAKEIAPLKAQLRMKKTELKLLVVEDKPDMRAIDKKIDEILALKRQIMHKRYAHKVEMRALLTPEQRVSFDLGLIGKHGHHRKGR